MNFLNNLTLLNPKGVIALQERDLLVSATYLMLLVVIPVFILTAVIAWRYRASNTEAKYLPNWEHNKLEEFIWWAVPCVIIVILANMTWKSSHALDPYAPIPSAVAPINIQVVALNWKWLFIYPAHHVASINELVIPVNTPIHFEITADAPMNSFWIPDLGGQTYAMAGMQTQLHLMASEIGVYPGYSANFSGSGFSGMQFSTLAVSTEQFERWINRAQADPRHLSSTEYTHLVEDSAHNSVAYFGQVDDTLFQAIVMKYMSPASRDTVDMMHH